MDNYAYRRIKATNKKLKANNIKLRMLLALSTILAVACGVGFVVIFSMYFHERIKTAELSAKVSSQRETITAVRELAEEEKNTIVRLSKVSGELEKENTEIVALLQDQNKELATYKERAELYNLYDYALVREDNTRTDIDYEDIKSLQDLCIEKGLGKDAAAVILAISMNESQGYEDVKNPCSSAAGLTGLINATAKYSYETLLDNGKGSYDKSYVYDSKTNLQMSCAYLAWLKDRYKGNNEKMLLAYRGEEDKKYMKKLCKYLGVNSLSELDI